jgi:uncharacterized DUF497 family protein
MNADYFTFDPDKDGRNVLKHGLSLLKGVDVYLSPNKLTLTSSRKGEERLMDVAEVAQQTFVLVYVHRNMEVRFISLRFASKQERGLYAEWKNDYS